MKTSYQVEKESQGVAHWTSRTSFPEKNRSNSWLKQRGTQKHNLPKCKMLDLCADLVISCIIKIIFHLTGVAHRIHQKSKYWKTHQNHKTWNISSWNDEHTKQHQLQKTKTLYSWAESVHGDWKKHGASKWSSETVTKKRDHIGRKEEPKSMKFEKPKCSSCKQTEIRSRRKITFLHTGTAHHIHEKSKYSITHHIHKTWNKSE